jgi:hypothetical protein
MSMQHCRQWLRKVRNAGPKVTSLEIARTLEAILTLIEKRIVCNAAPELKQMFVEIRGSALQKISGAFAMPEPKAKIALIELCVDISRWLNVVNGIWISPTRKRRKPVVHPPRKQRKPSGMRRKIYHGEKLANAKSGISNPDLLKQCKWEDIELQIKPDVVMVKARNEEVAKFLLEDIGLRDHRNRQANKLWRILLKIGKRRRGDSIQPTEEPMKKSISRLRKVLQEALDISGDPIPFSYKEQRYNPRFRVTNRQ